MSITGLIVRAIRIYQKFLSPDHGRIRAFFINNSPKCVFYPTCSEYSAQAFSKYGFLKGLSLSVSRVLRCHPLQEPKIDNLP